MAVEYQVIIIYAVTRKYLLDIPTTEIQDFQEDLFKFVDSKYPEIPEKIRQAKEITPEIDELLGKAIAECKAQR